MKIGLDFDGTYTEDPKLWDDFIADAENRGNDVYLVTCRPPEESEEVFDMLSGIIQPDHVFFTSGKAKEPFMEAQEIEIDIWIDNEPEFIKEDKYDL